MTGAAASEQVDVTAKAIPFQSKATLLRVLKNEIGMLNGVMKIAEGHRDAEQPDTAEHVWFDAWVLRLEDLINQAQIWATVVESGTADQKAEVKEDLVAEKKILGGLIGLTNIAIMTGIKDEETDDLIKYYRKDFQKTGNNIKNLLETQVWS